MILLIHTTIFTGIYPSSLGTTILASRGSGVRSSAKPRMLRRRSKLRSLRSLWRSQNILEFSGEIQHLRSLQEKVSLLRSTQEFLDSLEKRLFLLGAPEQALSS
jgi:hypothetical protein